jgi:hypothetical protein
VTRLGVDPGLHGGWALLDARGRLVAADHFPILNDEIDGVALADTWRDLAPTAATVEAIHSFGADHDGRSQGMQGMINFGTRYGVVLGILAALKIPTDGVRQVEWKKATGVTSVKGTSLAAAKSIWPDAAHLFTRKLDDPGGLPPRGNRSGCRVRQAGRRHRGCGRHEEGDPAMRRNRMTGKSGDIYELPRPEQVAEVIDACGGWEAARERWGDRCCDEHLNSLLQEGRRLTGSRPVRFADRRSRSRTSHRLIWGAWDRAVPLAALGVDTRTLQEV